MPWEPVIDPPQHHRENDASVHMKGQECRAGPHHFCNGVICSHLVKMIGMPMDLLFSARSIRSNTLTAMAIAESDALAFFTLRITSGNSLLRGCPGLNLDAPDPGTFNKDIWGSPTTEAIAETVASRSAPT